MSENKKCPRCGGPFKHPPALSRRDNKTDICSDCGVVEALEDAGICREYDGPAYWEEDAKANGA